jgi:hypothetical protein
MSRLLIDWLSMSKGSHRRPGSHAAYCEGWERGYGKSKNGENEAETRENTLTWDVTIDSDTGEARLTAVAEKGTC